MLQLLEHQTVLHAASPELHLPSNLTHSSLPFCGEEIKFETFVAIDIDLVQSRVRGMMRYAMPNFHKSNKTVIYHSAM